MEPDDIVGVAEIAARLNVQSVTIHQWRFIPKFEGRQRDEAMTKLPF